MKIPPPVLDMTITPNDGRRTHLWLPLFLLWPTGLVFVALALALTIVADLVLLIVGRRYHHYTLLVMRSLGVLCDARGMVVHVNDGNANIEMAFK